MNLRVRRSFRSALTAASVLLAALVGCGGGASSSQQSNPASAGLETRAHALAVASPTSLSAADPNTPGAVGNFYVGHSETAIEAAETPISLAFLNDHVAGARGQIQNVGGKLFLSGSRIRLYGVTMYLGALMPTHANAAKIATRLRKEGFNAVRLFGWDKELVQPNTWTVSSAGQGVLNTDQSLNPAAMDNFDYFVYQLQQAGIYVQIPLHSSRKYKEALDCIDFCEGLDLYLPSLIQSHKNLAATILTHTNPYTAKAYNVDPGVVAVEINNESSLSHRWAKGTIDVYLTDSVMYPKYGAPLETLWRNWVQAKYGTVAAASAAYGQTLTSFNDLKAPLRANLATIQGQLFKDWTQFCGETEAGYYADMYNYLKTTVGVQSLVMATQTHYTPMFARMGDVAAYHSYHGDVGTNTGIFNPGSGAPVIEVQNRSLLSFLEPKDSSLLGIHERKDLTKPNFLTEYAARVGNQYMAESEPIVSAYAGFQDLDAIYMTDAHSMNDYGRIEYFTGYYNVSVSAVARVAAALSFRRGDVTPGQPMVLKKTKQSYLDTALTWKQWSLVNFHFGGNVRAPITMNMYQQIVPNAADENLVTGGAAVNGTYTTTTGQMFWKPLDRITVNTPMTKTAMGLFSQTSVDLGSGFLVNVGTTMNNYAVLQLTSLTSGTVLPASRMLLSLSGYFTVPGEYPRTPGQRTYAWGTAEPRIEAVPATVRIPTAKNLLVTALDRTGARKLNVPVVQNGTYAEFVAGPAYDTGWYLIEDAGLAAPANNLPSVTVSAPATANVGTPTTLTATASDSDGTVSKVEFFDGTTLIGTDTTAPYSVSWTPATPGTHSLTARATDNLGGAANSTAANSNVTGSNNPPTVTLSAPASGTVGTPVTLSATASDSDGTIAKVEFFDGTILIGTDTTAPYSVSWTPTFSGFRNLTARATDNLGAVSTSAPVNVPVSGSNNSPTVTLSAPSTATVGTPVTLSATASDTDGTIAKVEFFDGATLIGTDTIAPYSVSWTPSTSGSHGLTARATDNLGAATNSTAVSVTVSGSNSPPTVTLSAPPTATVGTPVTLSATASDSDGTIAKVEFFDGGALIGTDTTAAYSVSWTPSTSGSHNLTARATDNLGAATNSTPFTVAVSSPNTPPTVSLSAPPTGTVGTPMTLSATAADTGGTVAKVEFFDGAALIGTDTTSPYSITWTPSTSGNHSLTARATDNLGAATNSTPFNVMVSSPNSAPTVSLSAPATAIVGTPVSLTATAADTDGTVAKVEFFDGSTLIGTDTSAPYSTSWNPSTSGNHSLTARATDNLGAATNSTPFNVTVSSPNSAPTVSLSAPAAGIIGTSMTLSATAADSDGTVAKVEFFDGATLIGTDSTSPYSIAWTPLTTGTHSITARATDNLGRATTSAATTVQVSSANGLLANYFANTTLSGTTTLTRVEAVSYVWSGGATPGQGIPADNWSVRWTGSLKIPATGTYLLQVTSDDGIRVWVNGQLVVDRWSNSGNTAFALSPLSATVGSTIPLKIEHFDGVGDSTIKLRWKTPTSTVYWIDVPATQLAPN